MGFLNKFLTLSFIFLILTSLIVLSTKPTEVQATPKPSVPQFTIKLINESYNVPPSQTTDPHTGIATTIPGYRVDSKHIEVTIKNQPFTPYTDADGNYCKLYYNVEIRDHSSETWEKFGRDIEQTNSQYTTVSRYAENYVTGDKLDFRVEAFTGYVVGISTMWWVVVDESSGWSNVQTFTIPSKASTVSPSQTVTLPENSTTTPDNNQPQQPNQPQIPNFVTHPLVLLGISVLFAGIVIAVVLTFTKHHITPQTSTKQQHYKTT